MYRLRLHLVFLTLTLMMVLPSARAAEGPFIGADLGVSEPTNGNYRGHVQTGASGSPFFGYMFNDYLGLELEGHIIGQQPDNDHRRFTQSNIDNESKWTTMAGATFGPRFELPLGEVADLYITGQGGGFKGLSGRLNQWAPGFSVGGGLDFNLTHNFAIGVFGRWNRAYMAPHPYQLNGVVGINEQQIADEQGPADVRWATAGLSLKYSFNQEAPPPPPPPPPPPAAAAPPPVPVKKKLVLRSVHFDFDKSNIRSDARPVLDEAVNVLKNEGGIAVIAEGHTDSKGTDEYNLKLSRRRAQAVRDYLVSHGIAASRVRTEGFGESKPVASNDTDDGRAQNRRVELRVE